MSARTAIKAFGRRVGDVRYVGRLARLSAAVWRTPYTAATLQELKTAVTEITVAQQETAAKQVAQPDGALGAKLDAIADGYGAALSGLQKAMRTQEQQIETMRHAIETQASNERMEAHGRFVSLEAELAALRATVAQLKEEKARSDAKPSVLPEEITVLKEQTAALTSTIASIGEKMGWIGVDNDNIRARLDTIHTELTTAVSHLQGEVQRGAAGAAAAAPQAELMSLKEQASALNGVVTSISEKLGWISVDNDNIRSRLEFIRTEVMFELRKQMHLTNAKAKADADADPATTPRIVNPDKVGAAGPKRLNLGSGHLAKDGYINVDFRALPGVDVVGDVTALDFEPGTIDTIFASHLIEHFPVKALHDVVLPHWRELLRPGGALVLIAPDGAAMLEAYKDGVFTFDELREVLYGGQEYEGDFHFNMLSPSSAEALLTKLGFTAIRVDAAGRRNGNCLEFEIYAEKPLS